MIKLAHFQLYDKTSRPVTQDRDNVTVHIGISLYHILDTNEKYQTISLLIAVRLVSVVEHAQIRSKHLNFRLEMARCHAEVGSQRIQRRRTDLAAQWYGNVSFGSDLAQLYIYLDLLWTPDIVINNK